MLTILPQDANACDQDILELRTHQQMLSQELEEKQTTFQQLQSNADTLDGDLDRLVEVKQKVSDKTNHFGDHQSRDTLGSFKG